MAGSKKYFLRAFGRQFGLKIRGGRILGSPPPQDPPLVLSNISTTGARPRIARKRRKEDFFSVNKVRSQILNTEAVIIES